MASLIEQIGEQHNRGQVKVLLLVRDAAVFKRWVHQKPPDAVRGGPADYRFGGHWGGR